MATPQQIDFANTATNLMDMTVCLSVTIETLGNRRKMPTQNVEVDAEPERINVSKQLLASKELQSVRSLDGEAREYLYSRCLPNSGIFKAGTYLLPNKPGKSLIPAVEAYLKDYKSKRSLLIDAFVDAYPSLLRESKTALRSNFVESEYPAIDYVSRPSDGEAWAWREGSKEQGRAELREYFGVSWQYLTFGPADALKQIDNALFEEQKELFQQKFAEAQAAVETGFMLEFKKLVDAMNDRLTPDAETGKKKKFHDTLVTNMTDWLALVEARFVNSPVELDALVSKARALVNGVDPDTLRTEEGLRDSVQLGFSQIKATLDTMVENKKSRPIMLSEAEPVAV